MKNTTKIKIINIVKRIIKYQEPIIIPTKQEDRKIQIVEWEGVIKKGYDESYLNYMIAKQLSNHMVSINAVDIEKVDISTDDYKIHAKAYFIYPF